MRADWPVRVLLDRVGEPLLAGGVATLSPATLARAMSSPAGGVLVDAVFKAMEGRVRPEASDVRAVIEWRIARGPSRRVDVRQMVVADGRAARAGDLARRPNLTLALEGAAFLRLVSGAAPARELVRRGELRVAGDAKLAARLPHLFAIRGVA